VSSIFKNATFLIKVIIAYIKDIAFSFAEVNGGKRAAKARGGKIMVVAWGCNAYSDRTGRNDGSGCYSNLPDFQNLADFRTPKLSLIPPLHSPSFITLHTFDIILHTGYFSI
jgi:hypothetical protein